MNRGVLIKSFREVAPVTALFGLLLLVFEAVLTFVLATFQKQFSQQLMELPFVQNLVRAFIGAEQQQAGMFGPDMFAALPWAHPAVLALVWGHAIVTCSRMPSGEVDRGSIDVLLGLPVSRWRLYLTDSLATGASAAFVVAMVYAGNLIANGRIEPALRQSPGRLAIAAVSLLALHFSVGGLAWMCSALSNRRGRAIGAAFVVAVAWLLINTVGQLWEPARRLVHASVLHYHEPLAILRTGDWPHGNLLVLLGVAAGCWSIGGIVFSRRDLLTV
jgi:hypothetical protein